MLNYPSNQLAATSIVFQADIRSSEVSNYRQHINNLVAQRRWLNPPRPSEGSYGYQYLVLPVQDLDLLREAAETPRQWATRRMDTTLTYAVPPPADDLVAAKLQIQKVHPYHAPLAVAAFLMFIAAIICGIYQHQLYLTRRKAA